MKPFPLVEALFEAALGRLESQDTQRVELENQIMSFGTLYYRNIQIFNDFNKKIDYFQYFYLTKTRQTNLFVFVFVRKWTSRIYIPIRC